MRTAEPQRKPPALENLSDRDERGMKKLKKRKAKIGGLLS